MIVYHGGTTIIQKPDLVHSRIKLDFGKGFYLTTIQKQAERWALRKNDFLGKKASPIVNIYQLNTNKLKLIKFNHYDREWLNYVVANRKNDVTVNSADIVIGKVADDDIANEFYQYLELLNQGRVSKLTIDYYLEQFSYARENNQICLKTKNSLSELTFLKSYEVKRNE